jgi:uncharacterized protein (TIGR03437 family)
MSLPDGTVALYDSDADTFIASRKDFTALRGAYAAFSETRFLVDGNLLDPALVRIGGVTGTGTTSGAGLFGAGAVRTVSTAVNGPGSIQRLNLNAGETSPETLTVEAPATVATMSYAPVGQIGQRILPFTRTLAVPADGRSIVTLSVSGLTVVDPNFDSPSLPSPPVVTGIVNAADGLPGIAAGGLAIISGTGFGTNSLVASGLPLPTTLGGICATVAGVYLPFYQVSPRELFVQLPFVTGNQPLLVSTTNGVSKEFRINVLPTAPAVFRTGRAGDQTGLPTIYRNKNAELATFTNPIHPDESISIFLTGMGRTTPLPELGAGAPSDPLALVQTAPQVTLGSTALSVTYAGLVPGQVGVYQIDAYVPAYIGGAPQAPLVIRQGGQSTTLPLRVVAP